MKKITIFGSIAIAMLTCIGFTACNNDVIETPEPETYTVKLGWAGEILDVSYEPMTRATTDDLYGIQVYSLPKSAGSTVEWTPYAYGLFDDPNNITITLQSGYKYKFVATIVKNGKKKLNYSKGVTPTFYFAPFVLNNSNSYLTNKFDYQVSIYFGYSQYGTAYLANPEEIYDRPNVERFYGELSNYIPNESSNLKIDMKRASFGAKFIATGKLAVDGKLEIQLDNAPKMELALTAGADEISDIFTFYEVKSAWAKDDYTEDVNVSLNWNRIDGTVQPLGTHLVTFKRNTTTVVEVKIDKNGNDEGVDLDIPSSETGNMANGNTVTINDGEMQ